MMNDENDPVFDPEGDYGAGEETDTPYPLPEIAGRRHKRDLPVKLDPDELRIFGEELAKLDVELADLRNESRLSAAEYNADIKAAAKVIEGIARKIHSGFDEKPVECLWRPNDESGAMELLRLDTNEIVDTRPQSDADKQKDLGL